MKKCLVCGEESATPIASTLEHFKLYESGQWKYLRGNISCFGLYQGIMSVIGLAFPIFNTLRHWKYRKHRLVIEGITDKKGNLLNKTDGNTICLLDTKDTP